MFLIGISGSILPYLVLLGIVVMLSVQADASLRNDPGNALLDASEKQLVFEHSDDAGIDYGEDALFIDFYSSDKYRSKSSCKQQLFSFVEFLSTLTEPGVEEPPFCFFSRIFANQYAGFKFSGLSPPLFRFID